MRFTSWFFRCVLRVDVPDCYRKSFRLQKEWRLIRKTNGFALFPTKIQYSGRYVPYMGSIASVNPGVADVLQTLSGAASGALSSALSSSSVQSALQKATPSDIAQLSQLAQQLVEANGLFTSSGSSSAATTDPATLLMQAVAGSLPGSASSSSAAVTPEQAIASGLFGTSWG
jgi:hypothetical protein